MQACVQGRAEEGAQDGVWAPWMTHQESPHRGEYLQLGVQGRVHGGESGMRQVSVSGVPTNHILCKLDCGKEKVSGSTVAHGGFVGKEKKFVKVIPGSRKIVDDDLGQH